MPTASSGLPSDSGKDRKAKLSKDDDRLLSDGPPPADDDLDTADLDETEVDDDADLDDAEDDDREVSGTTLTKTRTTKAAGSKADKASTKTRAKSRRPKDQRTGNPFVFIARFIREVVGEMRKVLWPTRRELVVYTIAVIVFVTVLIAIVGGLDFGFARLVLLVFG